MRSVSEFVWITLGAIGDALMVTAVAGSLSPAQAGTLRIVSARNESLIHGLSSNIKNLTVQDIRSLGYLAGAKKTFFFPPTFGALPLSLKALSVVARILGHTTIGFQDSGRLQPYTHILEFDPKLIFIQNLANQVRLAGVDLNEVSAEAHFTPIKQKQYTEKSYILVHPLPANLKRTLPVRRWKGLLAKVHELYPNLQLVVNAAPGEKEKLTQWFRACPYITIIEPGSLMETAGYIQDSCVYVGVDTGITHLAGVLKAKSVVMGNNSNPTWLPYYNPNARILFEEKRCTCTQDKGGNCIEIEDEQEYYRCLFDISDETIMRSIASALQE